MTRVSRLAALVLGLCAPALGAQTPGREPAVVELPASTRAMGLGHAFQAAPDADGVFYNPALASRARGFALGVHWLTDAARAVSVSAATPWFDGGVAVGVQALEYGAAHTRGERSGGLDPLLVDGEVAVAELAATVAYGRELLGLRVGVAGRLLDQRFGALRRQDFVVDVGLARSLGPGTLAFAVRHLGDDGSNGGADDGPGGSLRLPTDFGLEWSAYGRPLGPFDVGVASRVARRDDGELLYGGGIELAYWPVRGRTFVARVGGRNVPEGGASPVAFGGSFWGDNLIIDYAFQAVEGTDGVHRVTLGWR
jgi:hypothetical protein